MSAPDHKWAYQAEVPDFGFGRLATNATNRPISASGYKPKIRAPRFTSALHPAPEIRTLNFRS